MTALNKRWLVVSFLAAACAGAAARPLIVPGAHATAPVSRCDWRYLKDMDDPEVPQGTDGRYPMSEEWTAMSQAGYRLVATQHFYYLFERCDGAP
jgi:hypothetical protein